MSKPIGAEDEDGPGDRRAANDAGPTDMFTRLARQGEAEMPPAYGGFGGSYGGFGPETPQGAGGLDAVEAASRSPGDDSPAGVVGRDELAAAERELFGNGAREPASDGAEDVSPEAGASHADLGDGSGGEPPSLPRARRGDGPSDVPAVLPAMSPPVRRRMNGVAVRRRRKARLALLRHADVAVEAQRPAGAAGVVRALVQLVLMVAVLTVGYLATQRLIDARPERTPRDRPPTVIAIETVEARLADNRPTLRLFGEVVAGRAIDVRAPAAGTVESVREGLRPGARVADGEELLRLDDFDARTALAEARANLTQALGQIAETEARIGAEEAQLAAAEEQADLAREDLARIDRLVERGTVPAAQRDQRRIALSQAEQGVITRRANLDVQRAQLQTQRGGVERLELRVEQAERAVADTVVTSPFAGIVRSTVAEAGREVTPGETLVSLYDDGALEARFVLTDAQYGRLTTDASPIVGRPVEVSWTVGGARYEFPGEIARIGAEVASERGGVEIYATLETNGGDALRPGAFIEISVPDRTFERSFRLPETALYDERDVYVNVDGTLERRGVRRLAFAGEDVVLAPDGTDGLREGEWVMTTRISRVDAGLRVRESGVEAPGGAGPVPGPAEGSPGRAELLERVARANDMTPDELRAMPAERRRELVRAFRRENGGSGPRGTRGAARALGAGG